MAMPATVPEIVAEFVGTYLLVFTVGCNVLSGSPVWAGVSIGCVLMVMIYALGGVSGANFNPAVSIALGMSAKMEWPKVGLYCAVQVAAGLCAGFSYAALFMSVIPLAPGVGFGFLEAVLAEVLYTFMLSFVVLNVAASKRNGCGTGQEFYGLAIGFVIIAGAYGAGAISGGCFNPAVAIGLDVSSAFHGVKWCFVYTVAEVIGAALAAGLFRVVRPEDFLATVPKDFESPLQAKLVSEFLGTYILVLTVGLNVLAQSPAAAFSIAASLMCMIYALGDVSGANFNPAVTVAILCRGKLAPNAAGAYIGVQLLGGITAAFTYALMRRGETFPLSPGAGYNYAQVALAEIMFTFVLCFVVLCVAVRTDPADNLKNTYGLVIGSCVTVGGFAIGAVSGGSLNPAVSVGISSSHILNQGAFYNCLIYSVLELIGGAAAAGVYMVVFPKDFPKGMPLCEKLPA